MIIFAPNYDYFIAKVVDNVRAFHVAHGAYILSARALSHVLETVREGDGPVGH